MLQLQITTAFIYLMRENNMNIKTDDFNKLKAMLVDVYFNLRESGEYLIMEKVDNILLTLQNIEARDIKKRQAFK